MKETGEVNLNSTDHKTIRTFGLIAFIFFGCLLALGIWFERTLPVYLFGALTVLGLGFILIPKPLKPIYTVWLTIAHVIGRIITTGILTLAYYLVITPAALLKRIFGGAPLPVRPDKSVSTYWVDRNEPAQPRERFIKRY